MRVVIASTCVPFVKGGGTQIVDWLHRALTERGHEVDVFRLPFSGDPAVLPSQMVGLRLIDLTGHGDRLIGIRWPAHLVRHHSKVQWFIHHYRQVYDLWGTPEQNVASDPDGWELRRMLFAADDVTLVESHALFTNSARVRGRLRSYNGLEAEVLYPPLAPGQSYPAPVPGDYLVYVSRVVRHKRQELAIEAMARTRSDVRLVVAGRAEEPSYDRRLRELIDEHCLSARVTYVNEWLSEEAKLELMAGALAVLYFPFDEDSYGYPSLEAAAVAKPVVTTSDSGGVLELVKHGDNGLVAEADSSSVAAAVDLLYDDRGLAARLGERNRQRISELGIDWDHVTARLLA